MHRCSKTSGVKTKSALCLSDAHLIYQFAGICSGVFASKEQKETGLLTLLPPPSLGQGDNAPRGVGGDPDRLKVGLGIWGWNKIQNGRCLRQ